jgi:hypothetical protein
MLHDICLRVQVKCYYGVHNKHSLLIKYITLIPLT